jgi:predicted AlkP superfamily phosphohydrolase/phosphomutase
MDPTVLIGLDGATFSILDPLMENGTMPFIKEFMQTGVRAELLSTSNPLTPPAWISLMTGRSPGNHGVFDFIWAEERKTDHYFTLYDFRDIQCETIWSIVSRQNGKVCSLNFPMMSPPPAVSGCIVPGLVSWKHLRRNVYPQGLYAQLKTLPGFNAKELAWDFDLEKKAERGVPKEEYENWIEFHIRRERQWFEVTRHLMQHDSCNLMAILFDGLDKISHMGWRFLDPGLFPKQPSAWEKEIRRRCLNYFRELDGFLAEIAALAGPKARVFMASDHGFGPCWEVFRVNSWLHSQGYLAWKEMGELDEKSEESVKRLVERHFVLLDWDRTTAYARTTTSNGIYIRVAREPGQTGIPPGEYHSFRRRLVEELKAIRDSTTGERIVKHILTKEEAYPGSHNEQAPDLTLVMRDHSFVSILNKEPIIYQRPEIEGTHYPEGIFLARGPGIEQGVTLPPLSIVDVTPTLLHSLGLAIPSDFEGQFPTGLFTSSWLQEHACRMGEPTRPLDAHAFQAGEPVYEAEEEAQILRRLKALGYLE